MSIGLTDEHVYLCLDCVRDYNSVSLLVYVSDCMCVDVFVYVLQCLFVCFCV